MSKTGNGLRRLDSESLVERREEKRGKTKEQRQGKVIWVSSRISSVLEFRL